ncbi:WD40 repeat domain-containing protein [Chloroflexota bacterium]
MKTNYSIAWSPNGCWLAVSGNSDKIEIWDVGQETIIQTLSANKTGVRSVSWSPDNQLLACGQGDWKEYDAGHVQVWRVTTAEEVWSAQETLYGAYSVCFAPNGQWLASGHGSGVTNIWYAKTGQKYINTSVRDDVRNLINGICFSADSQYVAYGTCYEDGLYIYGLDGSIEQELVFPKQPTWVDFEHVMRFSPDGKWVARGSQAGLVSLWRTDDPLLSTDLVGHETSTYAIDWSPTGEFLAGGSRYGQIKIWDVESGNEVCSMTHRPLHSICYSPDGDLLAGAGDDPAIRIWNVDSDSSMFGECVKVLGE